MYSVIAEKIHPPPSTDGFLEILSGLEGSKAKRNYKFINKIGDFPFAV